jgi:mannosyl-oligosaccharide alpha-1,2-mannosidase
MPSKLVVRFAVAVVAVWLLVILVKLPSLSAPPQGASRREAVVHHEIVLPPPKATRQPVQVPAEQDSQSEPEAEETPVPLPPNRRRTPPPPTPAETDAPETEAADAVPEPPRDGKWRRPTTQTNLQQERRDVVVEMIRSSWAAYKSHAWGYDEFAPLSKRATNWGHGKGIGSTIVDALDTLLIAGLDVEAAEAIEWVEGTVDYTQNIKLSGFETTIRILGGLLSTYQITGRKRVLEQATVLGSRLAKAFDTGSGVPDNYVNLKTGHHEGAHWNGGAAILSELGSLQMEHFTLSRESGDPSFHKKARRAVEVIAPTCNNGYCPRQFHGAHSAGGVAGLGSFGDSFYEYLLKQWILSGKTDKLYKEMWDRAARHTIQTSTTVGGHLIPNGQETGGSMEHLACFSGGLFALSYIHGGDKSHLDFAEKIGETCHAMYVSTPTGLAPDVAHPDANGGFHASDAKYILRPETVETFFYLWKATKDPRYRDWGFEIVEAINKHLKIQGAGYAGAADVNHVPVRHNDNMETFWFAETLKYLYLLFSEDELIDLKEWVFNTEAHPMRVAKPLA